MCLQSARHLRTTCRNSLEFRSPSSFLSLQFKATKQSLSANLPNTLIAGFGARLRISHTSSWAGSSRERKVSFPLAEWAVQSH